MKNSAEDRMEGTAREIKGKVKQEAGRITRNRSLQAKGFVEKHAGKAQRKLGQAKRRAGHGPEFKGVVKKIAGKLTNRPDLVKAGRAEMAAGKSPGNTTRRLQAKRGTRLKNPDPHRRG